MMYMADDFPSSLEWREDFNELEAAQQDSNTNIIALVDDYGPANSTLYRIEHDPNFLDPAIVSTPIDDGGAVITAGEANMADATTLRAFVEFSVATYPAENYVLVLWGHGAGWRGLCPDGLDVLTIPELGDALLGATTKIGRKLDVVAVDSCAEATIETMWEIHEYSRFLVASEKDVPFQGLPYAVIMDALAANPSQSVEEFASEIADDYVLWSSTNTDYSVTMGVFDLTMFQALEGPLADLSIQGEKYNPFFHDSLRAAYDESESYEEANTVDFGQFLWELQNSDLPLEIRHFAIEIILLKETIVTHFSKFDNPYPVNGVHVRNASGFSIYAPGNASADVAYENLSIASSYWLVFGRLLMNDTASVSNGPGPIVWYSSSEVLGQPNPYKDIANLDWPNGTEGGEIWVFRNQSGRLTMVSVFSFAGQNAVVTDILGSFTLATSSFAGDRLNSYAEVDIDLEGISTIVVQIDRDGQIENRLSGKYEIMATTARGQNLNQSVLPPSSPDDRISFTAEIPTQAIPGEIITIEVKDKSSGEIVGTKRIYLLESTSTVKVEVFEECDCPYRIVVPLLFAILPGLLILGFALTIYYQRSREGRKKS